MDGGQIERQLAALGHGDHACMVYESRAEQMAAAVPFITHGLAAGERCLYIADDQTVEEVIAALAAAGLDVTQHRQRGSLVLGTKHEVYLKSGVFDPQAVLDFLGEAVHRALQEGYSGFRITGEMTWALGSEPGCDRVIEYEALLNQFFPRQRALGICQYNRTRFAPEIIHDVLRTHPSALLGGQLCTNLYYEPPELVLDGKSDARRVGWMISQLQLRQQDVTARAQVEESLRQSEQRFARFMQHLPGLAWIKDQEGHYIFANQSALEAFQTTQQELYGHSDEDVFPAETAARFRENDRRAAISESGIQVVELLEHSDGVVHQSLVTKFPIPGREGETALIGGMAIDITEQKRAEKAVRDSERLYRAIGESIDYGIWICDPEGRNIYASESFLRLVGMTQEECSNFGWGDVLHPDDAERTIAAWRECVRSTGIWDIEHRFRGVDGEYHPVLARGVPVKDESGQIMCWAGINLDISRLKRAEASLREADRRKDEFLAMLAHELRNPLAPIRTGLDLLALGEVTPEIIKLMQRQLEHLVRLVDDLLDVSRIMRGKVELRRESVPLNHVLSRAVETARPLIELEQHTLVQRLPPQQVWLDADPVRLSQVIFNLLSNAAKYTSPGGRIELSAEVDQQQVCIRVRDNGLGMEADFVPRIFELFVQAERSIDRSQGGLGIGLTVCKSLVEMHGGRIRASSEGPGLGSEFAVWLPTLTSAETRLPGAAQPIAAVARRVLIVDDNQAAARVLSLLLSKLGDHTIRMAHDGPAGLELARTFQPELVLLDIGLPRMDGFEVARRLRQIPGMDRARLVALTGYGSEEDRRRSGAAGFDVHMVKPPALEALQQLFQAF